MFSKRLCVLIGCMLVIVVFNYIRLVFVVLDIELLVGTFMQVLFPREGQKISTDVP
jgi:hypothetical protein